MSRRAAVTAQSSSDAASVVQAVTVIMGVVVGLTFLFGFGNVLNVALLLARPAAGARRSRGRDHRAGRWSLQDPPAGGDGRPV